MFMTSHKVLPEKWHILRLTIKPDNMKHRIKKKQPYAKNKQDAHGPLRSPELKWARRPVSATLNLLHL